MIECFYEETLTKSKFYPLFFFRTNHPSPTHPSPHLPRNVQKRLIKTEKKLIFLTNSLQELRKQEETVRDMHYVMNEVLHTLKICHIWNF